MKKLYFLLVISFLVMIYPLQAKKYDATVEIIVDQYQGPIDNGGTQQKLLRVALTVGNGGGAPTCSGMDFTITGFSELTNVHLYTTGQDPTFTAPTFLNTQPAASTVNFTGFSSDNGLANGQWYYWLVADAQATVTPGVIVDAAYVGGTYVTGPNIFPSVPNPAGFRKTSRNYTIGTGEDYATVLEAAGAIAQFDYDGTGDIFMELTANYTNPVENAAITFTNHLGPATITFRPQAGQTGKITAGDPGTGLDFITLDGVQKIIFDGRPGSSGTVIEWAIRNIRTTAVIGSVVKLINDASNNTLTFLEIKGDNAEDNNTGMILFGGTTGTKGNDNNTISYCKIMDLPVADGGLAARPRNGIYSIGTTGFDNSSNTVDNCEFVDIFNDAAGTVWSSSSISCYQSTDSWTITNNHFYQTTALTTQSTTNRIIKFGAGGGYLIDNNFIGGQAKNCGGAAYTTSGTEKFAGIYFQSTCSGSPNTITNNTIANIQYTTTSSVETGDLMSLIAVSGTSDFYIGTTGNGNTLGSMTGIDNIVLTHNGTSGLGLIGVAVVVTDPGITTVTGNSLGAITVNGTHTGADTRMIYVGAGATTMDNNTIGGTVANSIKLGDGATNGNFYGIDNASASGITVTNNTLQNLTHNVSNLAFGGIYNADGPLTCTGNVLHDITTNSSNASFFMINHQPATAATGDISNNNIYNISLTSTSSFPKFFGISCNSASAITCNDNTIGSAVDNNMSFANNFGVQPIYHSLGGTLTCNNNTIQEFNLTSTGANAFFEGIVNVSGAGAINATGNTIKNIDCASSYANLAMIGIKNASTATGNTFGNNTIINNNLVNTGVIGQWNLGIYCSAGNGSITKNLVSGLTMASASTSAEIDGIDISAGTWDIYNNVVLLDNAPNTNSVKINGIYLGGSGTITAYHNTAKIAGAIAAGTAGTNAIYSANSGTKTINNNIFQNLRTGTGIHAAFHLANTATLTTNYNFLEVANNQNQLCYYTSDNTFAQWQTNTGANNSLNGTATLDATGTVTSSPFAGAGTGTDLTATVPDDKNNVTRTTAPWMGAYEGQNITTGNITPTSYCAGNAVSVPFTIGGSGAFVGGNVFTAQLSDASGSFAAPTAIGTLASTTSGTVSATLPGGISGTGYRIRVISDSPVVTGSEFDGGDEAGNINIQNVAPAAPTANAASGTSCSSFTANWTAVASATGYFLDVATDAGFTVFVTGYNNLDIGDVPNYPVTGLFAGTTYYYRLRAQNACGTSASSGTISVTTTGTQQTYTVTSMANGTTSDGVSLRWAITQANVNCGHDIINFNLGAGGPFTISLTAILPDLTDSDGATINGWDNSGNNGTPNTISVFNATTVTPLDANHKIILGNSNNLPTGLILAGNNNIIKGLVLQDFGDGTVNNNDVQITINGNNNKVLGCFIGIDATGTTRGTKNYVGVSITGMDNMIGDGTAAGANLISGMNNLGVGVYVNTAGAAGNTVKGNMIGLQKDGTTIVTGADQGIGVRIDNSATLNTIGGSNPGDGNVISGNSGTGAGIGVYLFSTVGNNSVLGNIMGPRADGVTYVTVNPQNYGVFIDSPDNTIGGSTANERNIISANETSGVHIQSAGSTGNVVKGNYIGIDKTGTAFITGSTQDYGVYITSSAASNTIGGSGAGEGNVISGNSYDGLYLSSTAVGGNTIVGNTIGPQADGITYLPSNVQNKGIEINGSPNNIIGGNTAGARNIISANGSEGVRISGASSTGNVVKGNYIGIDKNGTTFITGSTQDYGIWCPAPSNTIGGSVSGEGNVISGNSAIGIWVTGNGNSIIGNTIGAQNDGTSALASNVQVKGIQIQNSTDNIVGGSSVGERNIISANTGYGVYMQGTLSGNVVKGNYIGIDRTGTSFIPGSSQDYGVYFNSTSIGSNTIGGTNSGEGNVISGNKGCCSSTPGIYLGSTDAAGNIVVGNIIGPQADGITYLASNAQFRGIEINGSPNNTIGGNTAGARNIISANETYGVYITGAGSTGNTVKGNYIGIDQTGTTFITGSTQDYGVYITSSAASNTIGGSLAGEGNVISGNKGTSLGYGIYTNSSAASGNSILGNTIGPQADGVTYLTSNAQTYGVFISASPNNIIGGNTAGAGNILSGNDGYGVYITGATSTGNDLKGNYIGLAGNGTSIITGSSQSVGINVTSSAGSTIIGGTGAGEGNVISGNDDGIAEGKGIAIQNSASNQVLGNIIGPQADGTSYVASNAQTFGIYMTVASTNIIGGNTAGAGNIISANETYGVYITGSTTTGNTVKGNYIGPSSALASITGSNQDYGVYIISDAATNNIGGSAAGEGNEIAFNTVNGVYITGAASTGNLVSTNLMYSNTGKPIELNYAGTPGNNGKAVPAITTVSATTVSGTSEPNNTVEVYKNATGDCNDASLFLGTQTADGTGNWSLTGLSITPGEYVLATATDGSSNTSEFSDCMVLASNLYWINFAGSWNDISKWSFTSGGGSCSCVPAATDNVIFDSNSFSGAGQVVTLPAGTYNIKSIDFQDINKTPVIEGDGIMIIGP